MRTDAGTHSDSDDDVSSVESLGSPSNVGDADSSLSTLPALVSPTEPSSLSSLDVALLSPASEADLSGSPNTSGGFTINNIDTCDDIGFALRSMTQTDIRNLPPKKIF